MPFHSFENPVVALTLVNDDGASPARIPLWTNSVEVAEGAPSLAVVTDVTVVMRRGDIPTITANLSLPYADGVALLQSKFLNWGVTRLEVIFGYARSEFKNGKPVATTDTSPVISGTIFDPEIAFNENRMDITLVATGSGAHDATDRGVGHAVKGTRRKLIEQFAAVKHTGVDATTKRKMPISFDEVDQEGALSKKLLDTEVEVSPAWTADWLIINRLILDAQCWGFFDGGLLTVIPWSKMLKAPRFILRYFNPPGVPFGPGQGEGHTAGGTWPILAFNSPTMGQYFANIHRGLWTSGIDKNGEPFGRLYKGTEKGEAEPRAGTGMERKPDENAPKGDPKTGALLQPKFTDGEPKPDEVERAAADKQAGQHEMGVLVEIETLGIPNLVPGRDTIKVEGFGPLYDKNYPVEQVTHILSEGGFISQIQARSNTSAVNKAISAPVKGPVAEAEPDTGEAEGEEKQAGGGT